MNPAHGAYDNPKCFIVEGEIAISDGTKVGSQCLTVVGTFDLPLIQLHQRVAFGILCSLMVYKEQSFTIWANDWLSGADRSDISAAAHAAHAAHAVHVATYAAHAAHAVHVATYATAAYAAAYAAHVAASYAAAYADAVYATATAYYIDFQSLAERALTII
jgi:hypothetical protein